MVPAVAAGDGVSYSATIPAQGAGTSVEYCIVTSTVDLTQVSGAGLIDSLTLSTSPHSHYVVAAGAMPTPTPTTTPTPTPLPNAAQLQTPVLSGLTYNGGTPFVDGTNLVAGTNYTITAQADSHTQSIIFTTKGASATDSLPSFAFTFTTPTTSGTYTFSATPWNWVNGTGVSGIPITVSYTVVAASSPTPTPSPSPTPTATATPTPMPTPTDTPTPTATPAVQITIQTSPAGCSFAVDGTTYTSTQTFSWTPGSSHTVATTSTQSGGTGVQYVWKSWSDSGAISHTVAPTANKTYAATFTTQYYLTTGGAGGTVSPAGGWKNSGAVISITATPTNNTSVSYSFNGWTGSGTGSYSGTNNPASITMNGPVTETANFTQNPIQVTVQTNPVGLSFTVDGATYTSTQTFSWHPGSSHTVATTSPQSGGSGIQYTWANWSGGDPFHTLSLLPRIRLILRHSTLSIT